MYETTDAHAIKVERTPLCVYTAAFIVVGTLETPAGEGAEPSSAAIVCVMLNMCHALTSRKRL
jgi:hypothetical protein